MGLLIFYKKLLLLWIVLSQGIAGFLDGQVRRKFKFCLITFSVVNHIFLTQFGTKHFSGSNILLLELFSIVVSFIIKSLSLKAIGYVPPILLGQVGPFGKDAKKLTTFVAVLFLEPSCMQMLPSPDGNSEESLSLLTLISVLIVVCIGTALVLEIWAVKMKTTGSHQGVSNMVKNTKDRKLPLKTFSTLLLFAIGNSLCEEAEYRGLYLKELTTAGYSFHEANLIQSISFGFVHWHGIPSGITGVLLTFVYGEIMGIMKYYGKGMLMPVISHAIADWFIFTVVARKSFSNED